MSSHFAFDGRSVLKGLAVSSLAAPYLMRSARGAAPKRVRLMLAWLPEGSYAYNFVAREKGFWKERGLDVEILRGYGSLAAARAVADGQVEFGLSNPASIILLGGKGVDLRMIGLMDYSSFMGVGLLEESAIKTPKALEGATVGQTVTSSDAAFFPVFCERNGVDLAKVDVVAVDAKIRNQSLGQKKVDAITGLVSSMLPSLGSLGIKTRYMLYENYDVPLYGNIGVSVRPETLESDPELCQALMEGLCEGLRFTISDPEEATNIFLKAVPELSMTANGPTFARLGMDVQRASVLSHPDAIEHGLGWMNMDGIAATAKLVTEYQGEPGDKPVDLDKVFTNQFAGKVVLSDAEWSEVKASTAEIQKIIGG